METILISSFIGGLRGWEFIVIALVVLLLFGAKRIPSMMRNIGKGIHSFKQGIEDAKEEINREVQRADKGTVSEKAPAEKIEEAR
ncbi:MAG: twin-arginine translocase TatA/TatE family subunit [Bacteroides sp.]|nr:twin-arginine translocase TatA/TatE family subunit [Bacteroides sp.]MCM1458494.1 twin-arginine translocase TatA/TatE family subunit [Lachnoclostridium sp.]